MQRILRMTKVRPAEITVAHLDSQPASASHSFTNEANISREQQTGPNLTLQVSQLKFVENYKEDDGFVVLPYGQVDKLARTLSISEVQQNSASPDKSDLTAKNNSKLSNSAYLDAKMEQIRTSVMDIPKRMASWTQFFDPKLFSLPSSAGQLQQRLMGNLSTFWPNYCVISLILLAYCLFSSPLLLIGLAVFGLLGYNVITRNRDVSLLGQTFNRNQQLIGLALCSIPLFLLLGLTGIFFWLIGASACITGLHSIFHEMPQPVDQATAADNAESGLSGDVEPEDRKNGGGAGTFHVISL